MASDMSALVMAAGTISGSTISVGVGASVAWKDSDRAPEWLTALPRLVAELTAQLDAKRSERSEVDAEIAAWTDVFNTPGVETTTMANYVTPKLTYWRGESERLRGEIGHLERDVFNLSKIVTAG